MAFFLRFISAVFLLFFLTMPVPALEYSVGGYWPDEPDEEPRKYVEIQGALLQSYGKVADHAGHSVVYQLGGWRASTFFHLSRWLSVGAQMEELTEQDQNTRLITPIERKMWAGLLKINLTADTEPKLYALFGLGKAKYTTRFLLRKHRLDDSVPLVIGGLGVDFAIWKGLHLSGDYQMQFELDRWENFALKGPLVRHHLAAQIAYHF